MSDKRSDYSALGKFIGLLIVFVPVLAIVAVIILLVKLIAWGLVG